MMIMKLTNPDDFVHAKSYDHDGTEYHFEGYMLDEDQVQGYGGEPYGPDYYYQLHSIFSPGANIDYRGQDEPIIYSHPWVILISGDHTMYCVFKRFRTYADLCAWLDNPDCSDVFYVY